MREGDVVKFVLSLAGVAIFSTLPLYAVDGVVLNGTLMRPQPGV